MYLGDSVNKTRDLHDDVLTIILDVPDLQRSSCYTSDPIVVRVISNTLYRVFVSVFLGNIHMGSLYPD